MADPGFPIGARFFPEILYVKMKESGDKGWGLAAPR